MLDLAEILAQLGWDVATSVIGDAIKDYLAGNPKPTKEGLEKALEGVISVNKMNVRAATIVNVLAEKGAIKFKDSNVFAPKEIFYVAKNGAQVVFGGTGRSATDKTAIESQGRNSAVIVQGNAAVQQNEDGSISFHTGPDGSISFRT
jgi:hypothetical protein